MLTVLLLISNIFGLNSKFLISEYLHFPNIIFCCILCPYITNLLIYKQDEEEDDATSLHASIDRMISFMEGSCEAARLRGNPNLRFDFLFLLCFPSKSLLFSSPFPSSRHSSSSIAASDVAVLPHITQFQRNPMWRSCR